MDGEAWRAAVHGVTKSHTRLSDWTELNWNEHAEETGISLWSERAQVWSQAMARQRQDKGPPWVLQVPRYQFKPTREERNSETDQCKRASLCKTSLQGMHMQAWPASKLLTFWKKRNVELKLPIRQNNYSTHRFHEQMNKWVNNVNICQW